MAYTGVIYCEKCNYVLSIILDIVLGDNPFKITLRFLFFY